MIDARTFGNNLNEARKILAEHNARFLGEYMVDDTIFASKDPGKSLGDVFMRLRLVPKNIWDEPDVIVSIKETKLQEIGKQSVIPLKKGFETESEARDFIQKEYGDKFKEVFRFSRTGWQYFIGKDGIDLEDIEGHSSIEFKSETKEGLQKLLDMFGVKEEEVIKGPSVVAVKEKLGL